MHRSYLQVLLASPVVAIFDRINTLCIPLLCVAPTAYRLGQRVPLRSSVGGNPRAHAAQRSDLGLQRFNPRFPLNWYEEPGFGRLGKTIVEYVLPSRPSISTAFGYGTVEGASRSYGEPVARPPRFMQATQPVLTTPRGTLSSCFKNSSADSADN